MTAETYKRLIVQMVQKSTNAEFLELIYRFCVKLLG